jgi:hypothetical protein
VKQNRNVKEAQEAEGSAGPTKAIQQCRVAERVTADLGKKNSKCYQPAFLMRTVARCSCAHSAVGIGAYLEGFFDNSCSELGKGNDI